MACRWHFGRDSSLFPFPYGIPAWFLAGSWCVSMRDPGVIYCRIQVCSRAGSWCVFPRDSGVIYSGILACFRAGSVRDSGVILWDPVVFPCGFPAWFLTGSWHAFERDLTAISGAIPKRDLEGILKKGYSFLLKWLEFKQKCRGNQMVNEYRNW